jgi:N-acetylmuramoyl-L-alanine amidase
MKLVLTPFLLAVVVVCSIPVWGKSAPRQVEHIRLSGQEYLRLADWAASRELEVRWVKRDETVQLNGRSARLMLEVDSREAQFNGVEVWLSFPVVQRGGACYVSRLDAETTLYPLVSPPGNRAGVRIKKVCVDPGHGGKDPGYCVGPNQEKKYALLLAQELRQCLARAGFKVSLTRTSDRFLDLPDRPDVARQQAADLFVSVHFNAVEASRSTVQGAQVFCLTPAGASSTNARGEGGGAGWCPGNRNNERNLFLAYEVQSALTRKLGVEDHGVRRARFAVLRDAVMPAILIEAGFMSHPVEGRKIFTAAYRHELAQAIAEGILAYERRIEPRQSNQNL